VSSTKNIVWIASYPKSGNTWVRVLVCNLIFGPIDSAAALNQLAPDIHESGTLDVARGQRLLVKTHFPYSGRLPMAERTAAAIYVVRDPADVLLSNFHYARRSGRISAEGAAEFERYFSAFLAARGDPRWVALGIGAWDDNVRSWLEPAPEFPVLMLRYEDLLADAAREAAKLVDFLGLQCGPREIDAAVAGASFERMRAIEESDIRLRRVGIFFKPYLQQPIDAGVRFMRRGRSGQARQDMSGEQRARLDAVFGAARQSLGYA
jgi:hypothetical protein